MWRYGFDLALFAWGLNALALMFGALLGARAIIDPHWAAKLVRLRPDEQGGGFAEFRATYGGLFFFAHATALYFTLQWLFNGEFTLGVYAAGGAAVLCAAWVGTAAARTFSMWRDKTDTKFNRLSALIEFATGLCIGLPWLLWDLRSAG